MRSHNTWLATGLVLAIAPVAALSSSALPATAAPTLDTCDATYTITTYACDCGTGTCTGFGIVLPQSGFDCVPCRFSVLMEVSCTDENCSDYLSNDVTNLTCDAAERFSAVCPEDPYDDIIVIGLDCSECN